MNESGKGRRCLESLRPVIPYQYAQWVLEDPNDHDYRVAAAVLPEGEPGYEVAHRTGVIGQVFRAGKGIVVPDARNHPLYDPFDTSVDWELCFPVFSGEEMTAVLNFEGAGAFGTLDWEHVCRAVREVTSYSPPPSAPLAGSTYLLETRRIEVRTGGNGAGHSGVVELARAVARGGESTLLVGHHPELLHGRGPTTAEASREGLGVSYCYFGVGPRLDLLATGPVTREFMSENQMGWWDNSKGRYAFVLLGVEG
ncbi:MAG TPA: GAF domain-containing protein [Pyrinomonadaceae bacterium]|nr:GAF domain-containing protein [Pyrinomonadaceae bacterium]